MIFIKKSLYFYLLTTEHKVFVKRFDVYPSVACLVTEVVT